MLGLDPTAVDLAIDLDAAVGEVLTRTPVADVAVDAPLAPTLDGLDDVGPVLEAALQRYRLFAAQHGLDRLIVLAAPARPVVGVEAALAEVTSARVTLDQVRSLAEVGHVLGEVAAGLGDEGAQMQHHLEPHRVLLVDLGVARAFAQVRIQVLAVALELREPGVVVDAGAYPRHLAVVDSEVIGKLAGRPLHAVAKADHR